MGGRLHQSFKLGGSPKTTLMNAEPPLFSHFPTLPRPFIITTFIVVIIIIYVINYPYFPHQSYILLIYICRTYTKNLCVTAGKMKKKYYFLIACYVFFCCFEVVFIN